MRGLAVPDSAVITPHAAAPCPVQGFVFSQPLETEAKQFRSAGAAEEGEVVCKVRLAPPLVRSRGGAAGMQQQPAAAASPPLVLGALHFGLAQRMLRR